MAEIVHCPKCRKTLQVPESYFGQTVQCPECRHQFTAASESLSPRPPVAPTPAEPSRKPAYDDHAYDDDLRRRRDRYEDDDEFDDISRPSRIRSDFVPHRGGLIMALGIVSLVGGFTFCLPAIAGPFAWAMASYDLREIREGRMDPGGEGMTRAGQICGIIGSIVLALAVVYFLFIFTMMAGNF